MWTQLQTLYITLAKKVKSVASQLILNLWQHPVNKQIRPVLNHNNFYKDPCWSHTCNILHQRYQLQCYSVFLEHEYRFSKEYPLFRWTLGKGSWQWTYITVTMNLWDQLPESLMLKSWDQLPDSMMLKYKDQLPESLMLNISDHLPDSWTLNMGTLPHSLMSNIRDHLPDSWMLK